MTTKKPSLQPPLGGERLQPGPAATGDQAVSARTPSAAVAAALIGLAGNRAHVHLASNERRAEEIGRALSGLEPQIETLVLPPWDCLPYDRASPSHDVMGRRMRVLARLAAKPSGPRVLITSPEALAQRLPPRAILADAFVELAKGAPLDRAALAAFAERTGYASERRVDEPGQIAMLGEVIDIFPADAARPLRITLDQDDRITDLQSFDPLTQRSETQRSDGALDRISLGPASESIQGRDEAPSAFGGVGREHRLPAQYDRLETLFDLLPKAAFTEDDRIEDEAERVQAQIAEAFESRLSLGKSGDEPPLEPGRLYLQQDELAKGLKGWTSVPLHLDAIRPIESLAGSGNPGRALCALVEEQQAAGRRVVLAGLKQEQRALAKALARGLDRKPQAIDSWALVQSAAPGALVALDVDLEAGFVDEAAKLTVIAAGDVLGGRLAMRAGMGPAELLADPDLQIGDVVLHEDHGVGVLRDLKRVPIDGVDRDVLEMEYHGGARLLAPIEEIGRVWRYGGEESVVTLDRLKGDAWAKRRAEVSRQVDETAQAMVALARARDLAACDPITPPKAAYAKFAARFPFPETPDQAAAIAAVLHDLAAGRPMDRLICGDVGFGKTEVALRAAAAVVFSGRQAAIAAPTTVLARQHFETFQRRFAGTGIKVAQLSRLVGPGEAGAVREGLASGEIQLVIGTHALAGADVAFADLGLIIIDEEQKFGSALKAQMRDLAAGGHILTMTATPIPRTLQAAMVGVQDVSVIASPPARRRPIRTFLAPFDAATLRTALLRERRRGGQSFFVVPRIEDIAEIAARLAELVPELQVRVAHGELPPEEADAVMVGFADGEGDVLLATNIIESGLDVPRANTMFVWRPDRFGLAQLHQLRGRVGRGRAQGVAYLLADPEQDLSEATRTRLLTLEAFDRLGSGLAISARDLDLRGGGDLVGDEQAGHIRLIGAGLYQRLLHRAVTLARGEAVQDDGLTQFNLGEVGTIPIDYVPDPVVRINLYARLARQTDVHAVDAFEEEIEDRFGPPPAAMSALLQLARLQILARAAHVRKVDAGPKGVAFSLAPGAGDKMLSRVQPTVRDAHLKDDRLIVPIATEVGAERLAMVERTLAALDG